MCSKDASIRKKKVMLELLEQIGTLFARVPQSFFFIFYYGLIEFSIELWSCFPFNRSK